MENKAFLAYIDFSSLHEPQCKGADRPGEADSDFEKWTPSGKGGGGTARGPEVQSDVRGAAVADVGTEGWRASLGVAVAALVQR